MSYPGYVEWVEVELKPVEEPKAQMMESGTPKEMFEEEQKQRLAADMRSIMSRHPWLFDRLFEVRVAMNSQVTPKKVKKVGF